MASAEAGLTVVENETIDLAVIDMGLPGMSGTDVVRALRERPQTATLPVILMTGSGDDYSLVTGLAAGGDDYIAKPVRLDELVARVRAHLRVGSAWSSALEVELRSRAAVVETLGHLTLPPAPEEAAEVLVTEFAHRTAYGFISVSQLMHGDRLRELATFSRMSGVRRRDVLMSATASDAIVARARGVPGWKTST